jgi:predicted short-subunit dehydrogenase-like oxidoreductase (DUF2520 family)
MARKPKIAIVGPGRLGTALATSLRRAGYRISEVIAPARKASQQRARKLALGVGARAATVHSAWLDSDLIWFCVPDGQIAEAAGALAGKASWSGKIAFHASGALASDELGILRKRGASVASVHPLMTFVRGSIPSLAGVSFAVEGDPKAVRIARRIVRDLKGDAFPLAKSKKAAYHAWGAFTSPLLVAALVAGEEVARTAGLPAQVARKRMLPIVAQTLANYAALGPEGAFSGPIVRGDVAVIRKHLRVLRSTPAAREVYLALARSALKALPARRRKELQRALKGR